MRKLLSTLLIVVLSFGMLTACSKKDAEESATPAAGQTTEPSGENSEDTSGKVDVGIVLPTKDEPRWLQDQERFESVIKTAGYTSEVLFSQGSSAAERSNVEALIAKDIKILIICAHDAAAAAATVDLAKSNDITVIAYDRLITDTSSIDYYVTFDSIAVGEAMGNYLVENAEGTENPLYLFGGASTDNNAFLFFQGAWNILQPKIVDGTFVIKNSSEAIALQDKLELSREEQSKILGQITTDWDFNIAKSKAEANLTTTSKEDKGKVYVLAPNDGTSRSIADVFSADEDVTEYFITGQDSEKASVQYIIDGKQSMTVFKDTRVLAKDAMDLAIAVVKNENPPTTASYNNGKIDVPSLQSPIDVVNSSNVKEILIDSGYYEASDFKGI